MCIQGLQDRQFSRRFFEQGVTEPIYKLFRKSLKAFATTRWGGMGSYLMEMRLIFSKYAKPLPSIQGSKVFDVFSEPVLSKTLSRKRSDQNSDEWVDNKNYIHKLKYEGTYETYTKYFSLLASIYLLGENDMILSNPSDLKKIKEECHDLTYKHMVHRGLIYTGQIARGDMRGLFDTIFYTLLALSRANNRVILLTELSRQVAVPGSKPESARHYLQEKLKNGYALAHRQAVRITDILRANFFKAREDCIFAIDFLKEYMRIHAPKYSKHWRKLITTQDADFLRLTLGLDVWGLDFIPDAQRPRPGWGFRLDLERHHLFKDIQNEYLIFALLDEDTKAKFDNDYQKFLEEINFIFRIGPFTKGSHKTLDASSPFEKNSLLAIARLTHLFELIQKQYEQGKDYYAEFSGEFISKTIEISGDIINIWEDLDNGVMRDWISRWVEVKEGVGVSASIFDEETLFTKYYPNWYRHKYLPHIQDFRSYLEESPSCINPDFWAWFMSDYLPNNRYQLFKGYY